MHRILVIDDIDFTRYAACRIIDKIGYTPLQAASFREAVIQYEENLPDMIIADVLMPANQGLQAIKQIRKLDPAIPIIATSAPGEPDRLSVASELGAQTTLQKPFRQEQLLREIDRYLVN